MDFSLTDDQRELQALATRLFDDLAGHEQLTAHEAGGAPMDRRLWTELAKAGLLGLSLPEATGGAGQGFVETAVVLEAAGCHCAPVPLSASVPASLAIAAFGGAAVTERWVPDAVAGSRVLTVALEEPAAAGSGAPAGTVDQPATTLRRRGDAWVVDGVKSFVPWGCDADALVVSASGEEGPVLVVVPADAPGVGRQAQTATSGRPEALVTLDEVTLGADAVLPDAQGNNPVHWLAERVATALCLEVAGACRAALALTAEYTARREQFGKAIATFQAVGQRAADAYVDTEAVRLTAWQAAWRLDAGLPAAEEVAIAKFWADDGAQRVVHACQHLHGGMGVDRDYPLHRTFLLVKHLATRLGGATGSLLRLGGLMAAGA